MFRFKTHKFGWHSDCDIPQLIRSTNPYIKTISQFQHLKIHNRVHDFVRKQMIFQSRLNHVATHFDKLKVQP